MISIKPLTSPNAVTPTHLFKILASRVCLQSIQDSVTFQLVRPAHAFLAFPRMRFITDLKFLSFILSLSIAAPIAQDLESVPAGNQIDNGIDSSSNGLSTGQPNLAIRIGNNNPVLTLDALGSSSLGVAADNEFLMAARRQRPENRRYRPPQPPPSKGSIPLEDNCQPGSVSFVPFANV